jgi:hypothetical protein
MRLFAFLGFGDTKSAAKGAARGWLALLYGHVPIICKRFRYADITSVERGHAKIVDG